MGTPPGRRQVTACRGYAEKMWQVVFNAFSI
jgi:hypothetical protein